MAARKASPTFETGQEADGQQEAKGDTTKEEDVRPSWGDDEEGTRRATRGKGITKTYPSPC